MASGLAVMVSPLAPPERHLAVVVAPLTLLFDGATALVGLLALPVPPCGCAAQRDWQQRCDMLRTCVNWKTFCSKERRA